MKNRLLQLIIVCGILLLAFNYLNNRANAPDPVPDDLVLGDVSEIESDFEEKFRLDIPDDLDKTVLSNDSARAIVTKDENKLSILADLPTEETNYKASLSNESETKDLGFFQPVKGGYTLEAEIDFDVSDFNNLQITSPNSVVLQGILNL